eukprot:COSAG06_NODE_7944_length_2327_cov_9.710952_2_plen_553_part_00
MLWYNQSNTMAGVGARTFTFQLSSAKAERTSSSAEQYRLQLEPAVSVPYTAQPSVQLEQLAFQQTVANVDGSLYGNNQILFEWDPVVEVSSTGEPIVHSKSTVSTIDAFARNKPKGFLLTVPDGSYTLPELEEYIAKFLYLRSNNSGVQDTAYDATNHKTQITANSGLFNDLDALSQMEPYEDPTDLQGKALTVHAAVKVGDKEVEVTDIVSGAYVGGTCLIDGVDKTITKVIVDDTLKDNQVQGTQTDAVFAALPKTKLVVWEPWGKTAAANAKIYIQRPFRVNERGYDTANPLDYSAFGGAGAAFPLTQPDSGWGEAFAMADLVEIADKSQSADGNTVASTFVGATPLAQVSRKIKPVTFAFNALSSRVQALTGAPLVKITSDSTLFSKLLGFTQYEQTGVNLQNILDRTGKATTLQINPEPWSAKEQSKINRTKAIEFHCPTLVSTAYNQDGKMYGGSLASIPITQPRGGVEVWQAAYDNSVPISLHGGVVDSLTYSLTNQDGDPVNLQGSDFNATLRISWPDPQPPALGSAGAEAEDAYGLRDVKYVS